VLFRFLRAHKLVCILSNQVVSTGVRCKAFLESLFLYTSNLWEGCCFTVVVVGSAVFGAVAVGGFVELYTAPRSGCVFIFMV
jgi:hypothetical protein